MCRIGPMRNDLCHAPFYPRYKSTLDPNTYHTAMGTSIADLDSRFLETQDLTWSCCGNGKVSTISH